MLWVNVYKSGLHPEAGLLVSSYYADYEPISQNHFWDWAANVRDFDLAFEGNQTEILLITAQKAGSGEKFVGPSSYVWASPPGGHRGRLQVAAPLPWRWALNIGFYPETGRPSHHWHHYAVSHEEVGCTPKGRVAWHAPRDLRAWLADNFGQYGGNWGEWLRIGHGNATPGNAFTFEAVRDVMPSGVSLMNKARRAQARIFKRAVSFQAKEVGIMRAGALYSRALWEIQRLELGDYIPATIKPLTVNIIGAVVALAQAHKDNNKADGGDKINGGQGWAVRYGPTGATLADQEIQLDKKREQDLKYLQKFFTFQGGDGESYFHAPDAKEWFEVASDWIGYLGSFGGFDFLNPNQRDIPESDRLDNYTPLWPDLPMRVDGLPRPQKSRNCEVQIPDFVV